MYTTRRNTDKMLGFYEISFIFACGINKIDERIFGNIE